PGPRGADQLSRGRRWSVLSAASVVRADTDHGAGPLLPEAADLPVALGGVRAVPEAQVRDDRTGVRLDPVVPRADGRRAQAREEGRGHRRVAVRTRAHPPEDGE